MRCSRPSSRSRHAMLPLLTMHGFVFGAWHRDTVASRAIVHATYLYYGARCLDVWRSLVRHMRHTCIPIPQAREATRSGSRPMRHAGVARALAPSAGRTALVPGPIGFAQDRSPTNAIRQGCVQVAPRSRWAASGKGGDPPTAARDAPTREPHPVRDRPRTPGDGPRTPGLPEDAPHCSRATARAEPGPARARSARCSG